MTKKLPRSLIKWLENCNNYKKLDFHPHLKIKENLRNVKGYFPVRLEKMKNENREVYDFIEKVNYQNPQ